MPKRVHSALTTAGIRKLTDAGSYEDGNGLALVVDGNGNRRWTQRLTVDGKRVMRGLGGYPAVSLADARRVAMEAYFSAKTGNVAAKVELALVQPEPAPVPEPTPGVPTFAAVAEMVMDARRPTWTSERGANQWAESFRLYANPVLGDMPVDSITTADVMRVLSPIWTAKHKTARDVRGRMERVFRYAIAMDWRQLANPVEVVEEALPRVKRAVKHHAALPYTDLPGMLERLDGDTGNEATKLAFEFCILNGTRATETLGAVWTEIDLEARQWTIPAERMKARRPHLIPLSDRAAVVLSRARELSDGTGLVFPSVKRGYQVTAEGLRKVLNRVAGDGLTVHGTARSSFRDWASEQTTFSHDVCESAIAHLIGNNTTERSYLRTTLFAERVPMMNQWAAFLRP